MNGKMSKMLRAIGATRPQKRYFARMTSKQRGEARKRYLDNVKLSDRAIMEAILSINNGRQRFK